MIDQTSQFFAILTNIGLAKQANADALGIAWKITQMGVGDANGTEPMPSATQTALINERRRAPLNQLKVDPTNSAIIIAEQVIPEDVGGWWIREIGLYDADGDLVAIANCAPSFKPLLTQGSGRTQVVRMNMIVSNASNVELKIDPSVVLATRAYVDAKVLEELNKLDSKQSVLVATTANIALAGLQTIDGVAVPAGARVLVKHQAAAKDNGIYIAAAPAWTRAADADSNTEVTSALLVSVEQGDTQADTRWQLVTDGAIVLGTTALTFQNVTQGFAAINAPALVNPTANTPVQFDNSARMQTTAFAKRMGVEYSGLNSVGVSTALTNSSIGGVVTAASATPINVTLPPTAGVPSGATVEVANSGGGGTVTILASGSDVLTSQGGLVVPVVLGAGDNAYFIRVTGEWRLRGGSIALKYSALMGGPNWLTQPKLTSDKSLATTEFVRQALGSFSDYLELSAHTVLTAADVGKVIKAGVVDVTLPALASVPNGAAVLIRTGQGGRLLVQGGDQLFSQVGVIATPYLVTQPLAFHVIKVGSAWQILSGDGALPSSSLFSSLLTSAGYQKLPSGLIEQWGTASVGDNSESIISLPVAFPNAVLGTIASVALATAVGAGEFATAGARKNSSSLSTICVSANTGPTTAATQTVTWRAWGN